MGDGKNTGHDPVWEAAWNWIQREHERDTFDEAARRELIHWLEAHPEHHAAYKKAARLWFAAGMIPPENGMDIPDCRNGGD